jgi:hypothetical protein
MRALLGRIVAAASLALISLSAFAGPAVPEMDAGSAALAMGLVAGIVALIRERR